MKIKNLYQLQIKAAQCTLFRGISLATSIFAGQFYHYGKHYVRRLTLPLVSAICSSERSWDVSKLKFFYFLNF